MANLIIKPSAGGQLILKDEGDSAAITVATTGTTTFAENATLSGTANALGTVTAGTLSHGTTLQGWVDTSNTGVTFPTGHVLQVVMGGVESGSLGMSSATFATTGLDAAITPQYADSKILITAMETWDTSSSERAIEWALYRDGSIILDDAGYSYGGDGRTIGTFTLNYLHDITFTAGTSTTYQLYARSTGSNQVYVRYGETQSTMVLMEIKG